MRLAWELLILESTSHILHLILESTSHFLGRVLENTSQILASS